jgi:hypothetical protein
VLEFQAIVVKSPNIPIPLIQQSPFARFSEMEELEGQLIQRLIHSMFGSCDSELNRILYQQHQKYQQILKYLALKRMKFQYNANIQNNPN